MQDQSATRGNNLGAEERLGNGSAARNEVHPGQRGTDRSPEKGDQERQGKHRSGSTRGDGEQREDRSGGRAAGGPPGRQDGGGKGGAPEGQGTAGPAGQEGRGVRGRQKGPSAPE
eukprot:3923967-Heterocapsa_arctica.AAC.1